MLTEAGETKYIMFTSIEPFSLTFKTIYFLEENIKDFKTFEIEWINQNGSISLEGHDERTVAESEEFWEQVGNLISKDKKLLNFK